MADTLAEQRLAEFLRDAPQASREEIRDLQRLVEQYFLGEISPDQFKAKRLQMGTYGIRNVQDVHMIRVKIPAGKMSAEQLECFADLAQAYSKGVGHITTREDVQLYWIPVRELPAVLARAAAVGLTTREACGNSVRNVTACHLAGVSPLEVFDVTKHAEAVTRHFLRNPVSQALPRKFKIAFEGCTVDHARTAIHDIGAVAAICEEGGARTLGFRLYVGGGLGAAPMSAILLEPFTPAAELLRTCEAIVRVHDRLGDRKNKATARIKFVVKRLGAEAFRREVFAEREPLPRYAYPEMAVTETDETPPAPVAAPATDGPIDRAFSQWLVTNVLRQKQPGYSVVTVRLRLGDITADQMRALARIVRRDGGGWMRVSIEQNLVLRWIRHDQLLSVYRELAPVGLAEPEADRLQDVTSCPGASTCQLGIAASRGLAGAVEARVRGARLSGPDVDHLRIKISGCPNSCGQHHIADIGFFGGARKINNHLVPHFQLLLGGRTTEAKAEFGQPILKLPARRIPDAVVRILERYRHDRQSAQEPFAAFVARVGVAYWQAALEEFTVLPAYEQAAEAYRDWGTDADFTLGGMGPGECAA